MAIFNANGTNTWSPTTQGSPNSLPAAPQTGGYMSPANQASFEQQNKLLNTPQAQLGGSGQVSGWTGVSTNSDPYGVANIGYKLPDNQTVGQLLNTRQAVNWQQAAGGAGAQTGPGQYENAFTSNQPPPTTNTQPTQNAVSAYPAMANSYGLGSPVGGPAQTAASAPGAPAPSSYSGASLTVNTPDTSARGLNPWSLQGEANSRDTQAGVQSH